MKSAGVLFERFFSFIAVGKFQLEVGKHWMKLENREVQKLKLENFEPLKVKIVFFNGV